MRRPYLLLGFSNHGIASLIVKTEFSLTISTANVLFAGTERVLTINEWGLLFFNFALAVVGVLHNPRRKAEHG